MLLLTGFLWLIWLDSRVPRGLAMFLQEGGEPVAQLSYLLARLGLVTEDEEGQGLAEYALILALIAIVAIVALIFLGGQISEKLSQVGKSI
jgi:pilus assembly protein Flp/PilA